MRGWKLGGKRLSGCLYLILLLIKYRSGIFKEKNNTTEGEVPEVQ